MKKIVFYQQIDKMDCGPTCLKIVAKYYGKTYSIQSLRKYCGISKSGVNLLGICEAATKIGLNNKAIRISLDNLMKLDEPVVLHWEQNHFVVFYKFKKGLFYIADPAEGLVKYTVNEFIKFWCTQNNSGIALLLETTPSFFENEGDNYSRIGFGSALKHLTKYNRLLIQLVLGLVVGVLLQLLFPIITQSIVDVGINGKNLNFIAIVLIAQFVLVVSRIMVDFIRSWIILHISSRINISLLTDFLIKLLKLPISFFDTKLIGDIIQRMNDQKRIEYFLTTTSLSILSSALTFISFSFMLLFYHVNIFLITIFASAFSILWISVFLNKRKNLDIKVFEYEAKNHGNVIQLINGLQEIKLNNSEKQKRWVWEDIQASLFKYNIKGLALTQYQQMGAFLINESKNIIITFLSAKAVISGEISIGMMMAIQYAVGQLNNPIELFLSYIQSIQDAKLSMERLNDIYALPDEVNPNSVYFDYIPKDKNILIKNLSFFYPGAGNEAVLKDLNFTIPQNKITAIVGMSGSGKTTLLKLLLRFYDVENGTISVGGINLNKIEFKLWRERCGAVMQEGYIFSDTISGNIAVGEVDPDIEKLIESIRVANIYDFIEGLPLGLKTVIGADGNGLSQGQKQRILIARSVYKNPDFIFFDEATNALDAKNEKIIVENLRGFFKSKTVVIVAHRLSTVMDADNIILLENGNILEQGNHNQLIYLKGKYFELVKNQLALGD